MENAFGSELTPLLVPMQTQYYNGRVFLTHTEDHCSVIGTASFVDPNLADALVPGDLCVFDALGRPGGSGLGCALTQPHSFQNLANQGQYVVRLGPLTSGRVGTMDLIWSSPSWLHFNWRGSGLEPPRARIGLGIYQGDRRSIYTREVHGN